MADALINETILYLLVQLCKVHHIRIDRMLSAHGVASGHDMFLISLWDRDGQTHAELAQQLRVQPATVTNMLHRMEDKGLITRRQDDQDLRIWRVYLTDKGRALQHSLQDVWLEAEARTTQGLTQEERLLLRRLLLHVYQNIEADA
jgi:DNA-binding MarR family transcriptional regulator